MGTPVLTEMTVQAVTPKEEAGHALWGQGNDCGSPWTHSHGHLYTLDYLKGARAQQHAASLEGPASPRPPVTTAWNRQSQISANRGPKRPHKRREPVDNPRPPEAEGG